MKQNFTPKIFFIITLTLGFGMFADAQNKNVDKGKETLTKAMEQTGQKRSELISKAREEFQKGGLKPQEIAVLLGDAYLEKNDLTDATNAYNQASKDDKKEGLKKVAEAYVEQAFTEDEKNQAKSISKAMSLFAKADATKEGAREIGDKFYEKGEPGYSQAVNYYVIGDATAKVEGIAKEYIDKGDEDQAAETYLKLKTPEGDKKAGDLYYNKNEYQKAIDAYMAGGIAEGIQKYADYLYANNRQEEADGLIMKLADTYADKKQDDDLEKLAQDVTNRGDYGMAAKIYDKAGNTTMGDKSRAYDALINFRLDEAKGLFNGVGDAEMVKAITDNEKALMPLKDMEENLDELKKSAPYVNLIKDSVTGTSYPSPDDQKTQEEYYKSIRDQVIKDVNEVSVYYGKLDNQQLKMYVRMSFLRFGAIRSILDKETFLVKKQKQDVRVKDVIL